MQVGEEVRAAMNAQIGHELDASYRYLAMSAWCTENRLPGCASWLRNQAEEELAHAMKFFDFIHNRGGTVLLPGMTSPPTSSRMCARSSRRRWRTSATSRR